jgi:hypothetical protein
VPLARHIAEKVHAYTRTYGGAQQPSTRPKDLIDILLIAGVGPIAAADLREAHLRKPRPPHASGESPATAANVGGTLRATRRPGRPRPGSPSCVRSSCCVPGPRSRWNTRLGRWNTRLGRWGT